MHSSPHSQSGRSVVALIATRGRGELLRRRAIPSILGQTRLPDRLVIVVDEPKAELSDGKLTEVEAELRAACGGRLHVSVLRNRRTPSRAAAAWNSGIDHLHRDDIFSRHPDLCFVAMLDDDDAWASDHIERCIESAVPDDLNMVASGLIRHTIPGDSGRRHSIPARLDPQQQFIGGQHIQGSNLFVRLDMLLQVGGFDEHLPSCTDRDICIRLAGLPALRFGSTAAHTVHHYADARPDRLSAPESAAKVDGLSRFWRKHADRFDDDARKQAADRAHRLFGWQSLDDAASILSSVAPLRPSTIQLGFVAGFVTDADRPRRRGDCDRRGRRHDVRDLSRVDLQAISRSPPGRGLERSHCRSACRRSASLPRDSRGPGVRSEGCRGGRAAD